MKRLFLPLILFFLFAVPAFAQNEKSDMEQERQQIQKELADLQKTYSQIKGQKNVSLSQLNLIKRKIETQERYLNNINRQIKILSDNIYRSALEIRKLNGELDTLKAQYARSVVYAYKNRSTYDFLNFIFSASNFNDALKRVAYLKSYRAYRQQQVASIVSKQQEIARKRQQQQGEMNERKLAQQNQMKQVQELETQRREKDVAVKELKSREKQIKKEITAKQKRDNQLKNAILAIVRREMDNAEREARKKEAANKPAETTTSTTTTTTTKKPVTTAPKSYLDLNAADVKLNADFAKNRGRLPWPVDNGVVSIHFGRYVDPVTGLRGDNPGITIATPSSGSSVKAVFDGEIAGVYNMGDGMAVTVRHGKYFTTYSNLTGVSVSKGSTISTGQSIGRVGQAADGSGGEIEFILMVEKQNVDPEKWLRR
jgi:murein hydrolase activator